MPIYWASLISSKQVVREEGESEEFGEVGKKSRVSSVKHWIYRAWHWIYGKYWLVKKEGDPVQNFGGQPELTEEEWGLTDLS